MTKYFYTEYFVFSSCHEEPELKARGGAKLESVGNAVTLEIPDGLNEQPVDYQDYRQDAPNSSLSLPTATDSEKVLNRIKYPFRVLIPHQYVEYTAQDSFFLQDTKRTFFARYQGEKPKRLSDPSKLKLGDIGLIDKTMPYQVPEPGDPADDPMARDRASTIALSDIQGQAKLGVSEGSGE